MRTLCQTLRRCTATLNLVWPSSRRASTPGDNGCGCNSRNLTGNCPKLRGCKLLTSSATYAVAARVPAQCHWRTVSFCLIVNQHRRHVQLCMGLGVDPRNGLFSRLKRCETYCCAVGTVICKEQLCDDVFMQLWCATTQV